MLQNEKLRALSSAAPLEREGGRQVRLLFANFYLAIAKLLSKL
ncbi:MAG: hypothetical protein AAF152_12520 [Cyanobacteria bacterium P01_A01_bin.114]